jgi:hypothetical protein
MNGYNYCIFSFADSTLAQSNGSVADCRLEGSVLGSAERDVANAEPSKSEQHSQDAVQPGMLQILANLPQQGNCSCFMPKGLRISHSCPFIFTHNVLYCQCQLLFCAAFAQLDSLSVPLRILLGFAYVSFVAI